MAASDLVSIIVPVFNEETFLPSFLEHLSHFELCNVLVVDGTSTDGSNRLLQQWVSLNPERRHLLVSERGRAKQMNLGGIAATGLVLLFLHADSIMPSSGISAIRCAMEKPSVVGGAFRLRIDAPGLFFRWVERWANLRSQIFRLPYGDQAIFVRRSVFIEMNGYADLPLMEDVEFIQRLKRYGRCLLLPERVTTSPRRWVKRGALYTTIRNMILIILYFLGVSPAYLAKWYR